jgi:hypothetical protein
VHFSLKSALTLCMARNVGTVHVMCEKLSWTRLTCLLIAQCGSKDGSGLVHLLKGLISSPFVVGNIDLALCELHYCSTRMKYNMGRHNVPREVDSSFGQIYGNSGLN